MAKANVLVGLYFDAGSSTANAGSITGYDTARPFTDDNLRLGTLLQTDVLAAMNAQGWDIPNDGVVSDTALGGPALSVAAADYEHLLLLGPADPGYFSTPSTMPGALIEPLFITDPYEGSLADSVLARATGDRPGPGHRRDAVLRAAQEDEGRPPNGQGPARCGQRTEGCGDLVAAPTRPTLTEWRARSGGPRRRKERGSGVIARRGRAMTNPTPQSPRLAVPHRAERRYDIVNYVPGPV